MNDELLIDLRTKFGGHTFTVETDPDNEGFFSVFASKDGGGCEVAGKIGERSIAEAIQGSLMQFCN